MTAGDLAALGVCLRYVRVPRDLEWMHEGLVATARRARGVAILRRLRRK